MVIRELIKKTCDRLKASGIENALFEAHLIIRHVTKMSQLDLVLNHNSDADIFSDEVDSILNRRENHEPLQYILGTQEFMSLEFLTEKDVLIPRSDTEALVEFVLEQKKGAITLLDIGTGTGCIPLSIAHYNKSALVRGIDISEKALALSERNAKNLSLAKRAVFEKLNILESIPSGRYDVITSNPPYIETDVIKTLSPEVKDHEPHLALDGGTDGLVFYRRITKIAPMVLAKNGLLVFEIGYNQAKDVTALMANDFKDVGVIKDLSGNDRVVFGTLK